MDRKYLVEKQVTVQNSGLSKPSLEDSSRTTSIYISENEEKDPMLAAKSDYGTINS